VILQQAELALMLVALGLYLYDSALLLHINEAVITPRRGGWRLRFGSSHLGFRGKELYLPSPFLPHRPGFLLLWPLRPGSTDAPGIWESRRKLFRPVAPLVWAMACALFVLLPLGLFSVVGDWILLVALALLYAAIAGVLLWLAMKRRELGLSASRLGSLAFELVACPPFAVNVVRRVSVEMPLDADLALAARQLQRPEEWDATRGELVARLDEQIDAEDEGSERCALLKESRRRLAEEKPCPA
jgi:hypothetical protein